MNKDQHKDGLPKGIEDALEVRVVAWLLGEASDFERAELEAMVRENAAVRGFHHEMKSLIGDARSAHGMDGPEEEDWKLSSDRRDKVMAELGAVVSQKKSSGKRVDRWPGAAMKRRMQWISMAAAVVLFGLGLWALSRMMFAGASGSLKEATMITARVEPPAEFAVERPKAEGLPMASKPRPSAPAQSSRLIAADVPSSAVYLPEVPFDTSDIDIGTSATLGQGFGGSGSGGFAGVAARRNDADENVYGDNSDKGGEAVRFAGHKVDAFDSRSVGTNLETQVASNGALNSRGIVGQDERFRDKKVFEEGSADPFSSGYDDAVTDPFAAAPSEGEDHFAEADESRAVPFAPPAQETKPQSVAGEPTARMDKGVDGFVGGESQPIIAGNRSGDYTVTRGELDSILEGQGQAAAGFPSSEMNFPVTPATPTAFEVRDFDQNGREGKSNAEVKREMFYSNRYEAPELPNGVGVASGEQQLSAAFPVTPATPTAFETDESGFVYPTEYDPPELPNSVGVHSGKQVEAQGDIPVVGRLFRSNSDENLTDTRRGGIAKDLSSESGELSETAKRELVRRQQESVRSREIAVEGDRLFAEGEMDKALERYQEAMDSLPEGSKTQELRDSYRERLARASVLEAEKKLAEGRYSEAESLLKDTLLPTVDPDNKHAIQLLADMEDEERYPLVAAGDDSMAEIQRKAKEITRLLEVGESFYQLDDHDSAEEQFDKVLAIDPYNKAAQRYHERIERNKIDYYGVAYNRTRSEMLSEVDALWEIKPPIIQTPKQRESGEQLRIEQQRKLDRLIVPGLQFEDQTLLEVVQFLRAKSQEIDPDPNPENRGVSIIIDSGGAAVVGGETVDSVSPENIRISEISLRDVPLGEAIRYLADLSNMKVKVEDYAIVLSPNDRTSDLVYTRSFRVPVGAQKLFNGTSRKLTEEYLKSRGVTFDENTAATFDAENGILTVTNTPETLESVETLIEEFNQQEIEIKPAPQVDLDAIFLEQSAADEGVSTFSLHVNDASFKVAAALLESGQWPDAERVREEEFVNALDYGDLSPSAAERIAAKVEQAAHPFIGGRNLVRIGLRTASVGRDTRMPLHLTILLDTSGSMEREDRREIVARSLASLATMLGENDVVSLVGFSRNTRLLLDRVPGSRAGELVKTAMALPAEGGTNIETALTLAGEIAERQFNADGQNRIVMLTDGAANLGGVDAERLMEMGSRFREMDVALDCYGVGIDGLDDTVLEALTRKGDGRYFVLNAPQQADVEFAKAVAGTLSPLALDVKVQVRFNPDRVGGYRLIGFRKQRLNEEDFRNDAVDGGEIAAAAEGNALYQVEVVPDGVGDIGEVWVRFRDARTGEMIEKQWRIPYDEKVKSLAEAEETMKMAGLAGLFAEALLKGAEIGGDEVGELEGLARDVASRREYDEGLKAMAKALGDAAEL